MKVTFQRPCSPSHVYPTAPAELENHVRSLHMFLGLPWSSHLALEHEAQEINAE